FHTSVPSTCVKHLLSDDAGGTGRDSNRGGLPPTALPSGPGQEVTSLSPSQEDMGQGLYPPGQSQDRFQRLDARQSQSEPGIPSHLINNVEIFSTIERLMGRLQQLRVPARISACLADISAWMSTHHLKLNLGKTELLFLPAKGSPMIDASITGEGSIVSPPQSARSLGETLDNQLRFSGHIAAIFWT
ncbi:hypothetical protein AAFF_G00433860, partial [Aldrovandia affinis]